MGLLNNIIETAKETAKTIKQEKAYDEWFSVELSREKKEKIFKEYANKKDKKEYIIS